MKNKQIYTFGVLLSCALISILLSNSALALSATITTMENVEVNIVPGQNETEAHVSSDEVSVIMDCGAGYDLTIQGPSDRNLYLNGSSSNNTENSYFAVSDGETALKNAPNTWGYSLSANNSNGIFSPVTNNGALIRTSLDTAVEGDEINDSFLVYYGVAASRNIKPGAYTMSNGSSIVYQLTASPMCTEYDVKYNSNGADDGDMISNGEELDHPGIREGQKMTFYAPNYSKTGYGFLGWSLDQNASTKITDNNPNNDPVIYGPNETITLSDFESGEVDNNGNITVYATWIQSEGNLQGWGGCDNLSATTYDSTTGKLKMTNELTEGGGIYAKSVTALTDTRDNEVYAVAKLTDGKCWTIENLRLNLENVQITKENTNRPTDIYMAEASGLASTSFANWGAGYGNEIKYNANSIDRSLPSSHDLRIEPSSWYSYGVYYKYGAVGAGNTATDPAPGDICPNGWRLPRISNGSGVSYDEYPNEYNLLAHTMGDARGEEGSILFRSVPNNYVLSGSYSYRTVEATWPYSYDILGRGNVGFYATANFNYAGSIDYFLNGFSISKTSFGTSSDWKYKSETVRCVLRDLEVAEVEYDANGGINPPSNSQSAPGRGYYEITITNSQPTRNGYTFAGWSDEKGNIYHGGDTFYTDLTTDTLYAKWENSACNDEATTISEAICLQDMNLAIKATMTQNTTYTLIDARDGKEYTIALLADGNVWMTKNLNLGNETQRIIDSDDSDMESGTTLILPDSALSFGSNVRIYNTDTYGGYYSFKAAMAGGTTYSGANNNLTTSICPAGWDLPTRVQFNNLKTKANINSNSAALASPYSFIYAGYINNTTINGQSSAIRLWTSTAYSTVYSYYSSVSSVANYSGNYQSYGESVRCILSSGEAEITYHGNGTISYPVDSPSEVQKDVEINSYQTENSTFSRPYWSFNTWNTKADGTGTDIAVGSDISDLNVSNGDEFDLYAKWTPQLAIVYHSNDENNTTKTEFANTGSTYRTGGMNYFSSGNRRIASWNTSADGTGNSYMIDSDYTAPSGMTTPSTLDLYAQWEPTYTITYNGNGSDGDDTALMSSVSHTRLVQGDTVSLYASNFSRVGYGFAGWSFDPYAANDLTNATIYGPNETITAPARVASEMPLYAVWIAADQTDTFQTFAENERCDTMSIGDILALTDERDDNVYTVAKLADGNCWMTENLRMVLSQAGTDENNKKIVGAVSVLDGSVSALSASNTNNPSYDFLHNDSLYDDWYQYTGQSGNNINFGITNINRNVAASYTDYEVVNWGIHQESSWYSYGVMYNWYTATAGRGLSTNTNYTDAVTGDICPIGWHLARGTDTGDYSTLSSSVTSLLSYPNNFVLSGEYYTNGDEQSAQNSSVSASDFTVYSAARYRGQRGLYWASNPTDSSSYKIARVLSVYSDYAAGTLTYTGIIRGDAVRCLASKEKEYTLEYNSNDGISTPTSETKTAVFGDFVVTNNTPSRSGYTFEGWIDMNGDIYHAGETYRIPYSMDTATLYATWSNNSCNPSATDIDDAVCLQDMNSSVKSTMDYKETYTLIDARDNKEYTIALLDDNNVWMTKNLNIGYTAEMVLTNNDTDLENGKPVKLPASISTFANNEAFQYLNDNTYGGYYNYYATTLTASSNSYGVTKTSICPKGWDLPTRIQYNDFQSMSGIDTLAKTKESPYNYVAAGYYNGSNRTTGNNYMWTSNTLSSRSFAAISNAYQQSSGSSSNTQNNYKYYGRSVRCIMDNGIGTIIYDANGGSGTTDTQTNISINNTTISKSTFTPPNVHKQFREWNTKADGTGIVLKPDMAVSSTGISDGDTITLYAQWDDIYIITYNNTVTGDTATKTVVVGETISISPSTNWSRGGYTLAGWDTDPSGETVIYDRYQNNVLFESDAVLYSVWKRNYSIYFDPNTSDANLEGTAPPTKTYMFEGTTFSTEGNNYSRTNYGFAGWSFDPNAANDLANSVIYGPAQGPITAPPYTADSIALYAVWVPSSGSLQSFSCSSLQNVGDVTARTDTRDGETYTVAKLADGECWMVENLRLSNSADPTLMATDSQGLGGTFTNLPSSSRNWGTSSATMIKINTDNTNRSLTPGYYTTSTTSDFRSWYSYGNYYSWSAAIADNTAYGNNINVQNTSICPAGWHLPNGSSTLLDNDFYQLIYATTGLSSSSYSGDDKATVTRAIKSFPNNFVYSGYFSDYTVFDRGYSLSMWTSTSYFSNTAKLISIRNSGAITPSTSYDPKYIGATVRCLAD